MPVKISPSLAAAPLDRLGESVRILEDAEVDYIHIDIEDGSFVPVMTLGTKLIPDLRPLTKIPFDVHLMMVDPEWILPQLVEDGADRIAVHLEACPYPRRTLRLIEELGAVPGLALNPVTPMPDLRYLIPYLKYIILLSTEPELRGSPFLPEILEKLATARQMPEMDTIEWVIDGGVTLETLPDVVKAGADIVVVGRSTFKGESIKENILGMREAIVNTFG